MADRPDHSPVEERVTAPSQPAMITDLPPGLILINQFKVEEKLGGGGMGTVYRCLDLTVQRVVAIKVLHPHLAGMSKWLLRFQQEARAIARLDHPNIVGVNQMISQDGLPFIVMDYIKGPSLADILAIMGMLSPARTGKIMSQVADALVHAHANGVVHRDLKPGNIVIVEGSDDFVKILDFGIAKISDSDEPVPAVKLTQTGEVFGSPAYMSPEQVMGKAIDGRSDQYSFGCMLYECLTGSPPFVSTSPVEIMMRHLNESPTALTEASLGKEFSLELERVVMRLLAKDAQERYQSMLQVKTALNKAIFPEQHLFEPDEPAFDQRFAPVKKRRSPLFTCVLILIACAVSALIGYVFSTFKKQETRPLSTPVEAAAKEEVGMLKQVSEGAEYKPSRLAKRTLLADGRYEIDFGPTNIGKISFTRNAKDSGTFYMQGTVIVPNDAEITVHLLSRTFVYEPAVLELFNGLDLRTLIIGSDNFEDVMNSNHEPDPVGPENDALQRAFVYVPALKTIECLHVQSIGLNSLGLGYLALDSLPKLKYLRLAKTPLDGRDLAKVKSIKNVGTLDITGMKNASYVTRALVHSSNVYSYCVDNCGVTDADMQQIAKISNLRVLTMRRNPKLSARALEYLPAKQMSQLWISHTNIGPEALPTLSKMTSLTWVDLPAALWQKSDRDKLAKALPHCHKIDYLQ